ncbi:MAG: DUF5615 family PIN-like protein [Nitrospirota bacterium]|nr:DUF5615 family PIN-like protein [Nitrospirota bacterium]
MKVLIDMNLSPQWVSVFKLHGLGAVHWSEIGDPCEKDSVILQWAQNQGYAVLTHDLDFGTLLALTRSTGPSVLQVRTQDIMPRALDKMVISILVEHAESLNKGALISVDEKSARVRILPIHP